MSYIFCHRRLFAKKCSQKHENMIISRKHIKICHLFFAAGAFSQNKCSKKHENIIVSRKIINICHIFFAAGAFSQKQCSNNHEKYKNF